MKKNIFLSKNRRFITTKKRCRKSKRGKNSKWNKRSKRVKTVNTNMRKNRTKKGRRNIQKGGVWFEVSEGVKKEGGRYNKETFWYELDMNDDEDIKKFNTKSEKDPAKTWRKYNDPTTGRDYYANDSKSVWDNLPPPNPNFEHKLSHISALLFNSQIESDTSKQQFLHMLHDFNTKNTKFDISKNSFHSNGKNQTILYAACRTPYVSLDILTWLTKTFKCSPDVKTSDGFYPLGALMSSLYDNIKLGVFIDINLVAKYIHAIRIFIPEIDTNTRPDLIKNKNKFGLTAYDDFAQLFLYNFINDCEQLKEICKLLLINNNNLSRKYATVLFEACSQDNIYPDLISRLIECGNNVSEKAMIRYADIETNQHRPDNDESGYPITALIKSYDRIKKAGGDVQNCKLAINIVYNATQNVDMAKIESEYRGTESKATQILRT